MNKYIKIKISVVSACTSFDKISSSKLEGFYLQDIKMIISITDLLTLFQK